MQQRYPYQHLWPDTARRPLLGFAAWSGTGKTTLLEAVIPRLRQAGTRVALVKHAHHDFDVDYPGKDSYELRKAGADQVLVTSAERWALIRERPATRDPILAEEIARLEQDSFDLLLVEGFRHERFPKIELLRDPGASASPLFRNDDAIIAVAAPDGLAMDTTLPRLSLDSPGMVARFILEHIMQAQ
ncbi:molybdopterin-guanine dinucleotide biosynthesis protein B [Aquisalimonas sp.]|uniref:molybdopterin-guanine dinucleotide biosynthesis protein B n=1 Tax=Aquisalimonas sp. TaxID=1872621 RepID=UPI0025B84CC7|nr:molybdopterin-guanine dinucleotide biosynthesis protein B [Aquisalimonas sp.]